MGRNTSLVLAAKRAPHYASTEARGLDLIAAMKRFEVIQGTGGKDKSSNLTNSTGSNTKSTGSMPSREFADFPPITVRYAVFRRTVPVLIAGLTLAGAIYWGFSVLPNANVQPIIGYAGLGLLAILFIVSVFSAINRAGTYLVMGEKNITGQILGVFGNRKFEIPYSEISTVGFVGQGEAPTVLITEDDKTKTRLPGLLFWDHRGSLEILNERVSQSRRAVAENVDFPRKFRSLLSGWMVVLAALIVAIPLAGFTLATQKGNWVDLVVAGVILLLLPYLAFKGAAPFVTYTTEERVITRSPWFRPDLKKAVHLNSVKAYYISHGPRRKLHLLDHAGFPLMVLEISNYDFSSVVFWAERALENNEP